MKEKESKSPTFFQVIVSVLCAMFGVQSDRNRVRDFEHGNPWAYIVIGIIMVTLFVLMIWGIVQIVLSSVT